MFLLVLSTLFGCEPPPPPVPGTLERTGAVVTTVNGTPVTQGMIDATLASLPDNIRERIKAQGQESQIKEKLVVGELLYQEALKQKLQDTPEMKTVIALAERDALAKGLIDKVVKERSTDAAAKKWYDEHKVQFARPQVKASHILVKDKGEADAILAEVKGGGDFAKIAGEKSTDPGSKKDGGSLGWFEKNRMVPEFAEAAFAANKGDIVGPVQTKFGFHVIKIEDKREEVPFEEAKEKIMSQLQNDLVEAYLDELKKAATITEGAGGAPAGGASVAPAAAETDKKPGTSVPPAPAPTGK